MTIQTEKITYTSHIKSYLPEINITLTNDTYDSKYLHIKPNSSELNELSKKLNKIN